MSAELMIEDHLRHVNTLEADGRPIQTKLLSRLFVLPVYFRIQAFAVNTNDIENAEGVGKHKNRKCPLTSLHAFRSAVMNTGNQVACLRDYKGDLVDKFKGRMDQDQIKAELRGYLLGESGAGVRRILGL